MGTLRAAALRIISTGIRPLVSRYLSPRLTPRSRALPAILSMQLWRLMSMLEKIVPLSSQRAQRWVPAVAFCTVEPS